MNRLSGMSLAVGAITLVGVASQAAIAGTSTTEIVSYSSYVQNKVNSAGSGYIATSAGTGTAAGQYFTNDSNVDTEGTGSGTQYGTYSLLDFGSKYTYTSPVASITGLTLTITEYPAAFGNANPVDIYLVTDSTTSDYYSATAANNSPLFYDTTATGTAGGAGTPQGLGTQLGASYLLAGSVPYSDVKNQVDTISLSLSSAASTLFTNELNTEGNIRLVVAQDASAPTGAAEYDGQYYAQKTNTASPLTLGFNTFAANGSADPGTLAVSAAPEPTEVGTLTLVMLGLGGLLVRARRRSQSM